MKITIVRLRYTQILLASLLVISLYITSQSLAGGISKFENNLWGRDSLVASFTKLRLKLGDRVFSQAVVGKEGWLEYRNELENNENTSGRSPKELANLQQKIQKLYEELRKENITLLLVVAPNKTTIYPEKLPDELQQPDAQSTLAIFTAYMQQHGPPVVADLRQALLNERKQQNLYELYFKTDTHWNNYGAFIGYTQIMNELSKTYPQLIPKDIKDFNIRLTHPYLHDIPRMIGANNLFEAQIRFKPKKDFKVNWVTLNDDSVVPFQISTIPEKSLPSLLIYMDSFGDGMKDFISYSFSKVTFIFLSSKYPDALSLKTINAIKPDIVIVQVVERGFNAQHLESIVDQLLSKKK